MRDPDDDTDDTYDDTDDVITIDQSIEEEPDEELPDGPHVDPDPPEEIVDPDDPPAPKRRSRSRKVKAPKAEPAPSEDAKADAAESSGIDIIPEPKVIRYERLDALRVEFKYWINPRTVTGLGDADIAELAASIAEGTASGVDGEGTVAGVDRALEVVQITVNGGAISLVIDGQRRVRAMEHLNLPPDTLVPVEDLEPGPIAWTKEASDKYLKRVLGLEATKRGLGSFELVESAARLRESKGKDHTLAEIAATVRRSESWVSKMLTAFSSAKPQLVLAWKLGEVTDEQFKDLAAVKPALQATATKEVVVAARAGDKQAARTLAKEQVALAKRDKDEEREKAKAAKAAKAADKPAKKGKEGKKGKPAVRGPQGDLPIVPPKKPPPKLVIADLLGMAVSHPPTHDYVKGFISGVRYAIGELDPAQLAKPWHTWLKHLESKK